MKWVIQHNEGTCQVCNHCLHSKLVSYIFHTIYAYLILGKHIMIESLSHSTSPSSVCRLVICFLVDLKKSVVCNLQGTSFLIHCTRS